MNPIAMPYQYGDMVRAETPEGYEDSYGEYSLTRQVAPSQTMLDQVLQFDSDTAFIVRGMSAYQDTGSLFFRFRDPDGYYRMNNYVPIYAICGDQDNVGPIFPEIFVPPSGQMLFDFRNANVTVFVGIQIVLRGVRRRRIGGQLCETRSAQPGGGGAYGGPYPGGGESGGGYPPLAPGPGAGGAGGGGGTVVPGGAAAGAGGVIVAPGAAGGNGWPGSGGL